MDYLMQKHNESYDEYIYRVSSNRFEYGFNTWDEVAAFLNEKTGKNMNGKSYSKNFYTMQKGYEIAHSTIKPQEVNDVNGQKMEIVKLQTEKIELNKMLRETARQDMLFDKIAEAIKSVECPEFVPIPKHTNSKRSAILGFSDIHFGKIFKSMNNEYSEEIARSRMNDLLQQVIGKCLKEEIYHLHVINLGDSVEGMGLRVSQLMSLQMGFVEQVIKFQRLMVEWLNQLSKYVEITYHHCLSSNHSEIRPLGTKAGQFTKEDMERIIANYVKDMLNSNPRITIPDYDSHYIEFDVLGFNIYGEHGHRIKNLKTAVRDVSMLTRKFVDYFYTAHLHHGMDLTVGESERSNVKVILLPSVMGSDTFSDKLMTGSKAGARLDIYEENGIATTHNFILN